MVRLVLVSILTTAAHAVAADWYAIASSCVLDEDAEGRVLSAFFNLRPRDAGDIETRCNVTNVSDSGSSPIWSRLEVAYQDPDGPGLNHEVIAVLFRVDKFTGQSVAVATFSSNKFGASAASQLQYQTFSHSFNFSAYGYFVSVRVRRTRTDAFPGVHWVRLR
jgi:hypothetical protein